MAAAASDEILYDFSPLMRVYKDGRVERFAGEDFVPASDDPNTGVQSKDVEFSPEQHLSARLYLPKNATPGHKLPVLIYIHGGGFVIQNPFSSLYHNHLNLLVAEANIVAVSVNYGLAPEYPVPICYEDSWLTLKWVVSHSKGDGNEVWLKDYADFGRFYLGGDSAGGNIVHNMTIRAGLEKLDGVNISGIFLNCPYFWGKEPFGNEANDEVKSFINHEYLDRLWRFACPTTAGLDDPLLNPAMDPNISSLACKRVLIYVAGKDTLRFRGWYYKDVLLNSGWVGDVEVLEVEGEQHVFNIFAPTSENTVSMLKKLAFFLNHDKP